MTFQKGVSGNPSGRPKAVKIVAEAARQAGPKVIEVMRDLMENHNDARIRIEAGKVLLDRGLGKPTSHRDVEITGQVDHKMDFGDTYLAAMRGINHIDRAKRMLEQNGYTVLDDGKVIEPGKPVPIETADAQKVRYAERHRGTEALDKLRVLGERG